MESVTGKGFWRSPQCDDDRCEGHSGKFPDCLTEALWVVSLDEGDESTGSTEAYGYFTLLHFPEPEDIDISNSPQWAHMITVPAGWYMVECQDSGAVTHVAYGDDESKAHKAFQVEEERYGLWDNQCGSCPRQREDSRMDDVLCQSCEDALQANMIRIQDAMAERGIDSE